tara:strand:+ start:9903 stop:11333 length:1431 start_codon:yes stop_codon:yes gene_type:complete
VPEFAGKMKYRLQKGVDMRKLGAANKFLNLLRYSATLKTLIVLALVTVVLGTFSTVLAADRNTASKETPLLSYPVAVDIVYKGAMVVINSAGYLAPAADTAGNSRVIGVADEQVDNSGGSAGDLNCRVRSGRAFRFVATSITQAMVGNTMYVVDDQTFDDDNQDHGIVAGILVQFVDTTTGFLHIPTPGVAAEVLVTEMSMDVRNESGSTMEDGDIVYVSHYDETTDRMVISLADGDAQGAAAVDLWVLRASLATATNGVAYKTHREDAQDTSSTTEGDAIYLSTTAGDWTKTSPIDGDPNGVARIVGRVAVVHASTGEVEINLVAGGLVQIGTNEVQDSAVTTAKLAAANEYISTSPTGNGLGYGTGAGGAVTQATNRTTGVTVNTLCGTITTHNASLAAEASADFIVTNSEVAIGDVVILSIQSGENGGGTVLSVQDVAAGSFTIRVHNGNVAAGTAETGTILINFAVIKAVSA